MPIVSVFILKPIRDSSLARCLCGLVCPQRKEWAKTASPQQKGPIFTATMSQGLGHGSVPVSRFHFLSEVECCFCSALSSAIRVVVVNSVLVALFWTVCCLPTHTLDKVFPSASLCSTTEYTVSGTAISSISDAKPTNQQRRRGCPRFGVDHSSLQLASYEQARLSLFCEAGRSW